MTSVSPKDSVLRVAHELRAGQITVDGAEGRLRALAPAPDSSASNPAEDREGLQARELSDDWVTPLNENSVSNLYVPDISEKDYRRLHTALLSATDKSIQNKGS